MVWKIEYSATALDLLGKLDKTNARRIIDYLDRRVATLHNPRSCGKALTGPLGGLWRYRVGDYRLICAIEDEHLRVLVVTLGHRREVYR